MTNDRTNDPPRNDEIQMQNDEGIGVFFHLAFGIRYSLSH